MLGFLTSLCSGQKPGPLEAELRRQRDALRAIDRFVASIQRCLKYWERSGKSLRVGIAGYFYDKPTYQRPVQDITAALDSLKAIGGSVKPQLDLIKKANTAAAKSIARVEKASKQKREAEKKLARREKALKRLQQKAQTGKDPSAAQKVKVAEDDYQVARNNLQMAEAELMREMQHTMNGTAPEAAMQVARALEAMLLFLVGSGVDVGAIRASIRSLEETQYISPLTAAGQQQQLLQSASSKRDKYPLGNPGSINSPEPVRGTSHSSRPASPTDPGSQQMTPRRPDSLGASPRNSAQEARLSASVTNPFNSD